MASNSGALSGSHRFLRRVLRAAADFSISTSTSLGPSPTNSTILTDPNSFNSSEDNVEEEPPSGPTEPPGPGLPQQALDTSKKLAKEGAVLVQEGAILVKDGTKLLSEKSHVPIWAFILVLVAALSITCLIGLIRLRRRFRVFRRTDEGKQKMKDLAAHDTFGKFVPETWVEPDMEMADLQGDAEGPDTEAGDGEPEEVEQVGRINYKMEYDFDIATLSVTIVACEELTAMDSSGTSDPYVKVSFLGDKKKKFETKVHRGNLNPQFNETFLFKQVPFEELMGKTVAIQVFDYDRFSSHDMIGEIMIPICQIDITQPIEGWKQLAPAMDEDAFLGQICLSFRYAPSSIKLTVAVLECKNLKQMDFGGLADPFVKLNLFKDGKKFMKKKTSVKENTLNPYYNEAFIFEIPEKELTRCHFVVTALDYDLIGGCDPIGRVAIGPNQEGDGRAHWREMVDNPKRPIVKWHTLEDPDDEKFKPAPKAKK